MSSCSHIVYGFVEHGGGPSISRWDSLTALAALDVQLSVYANHKPEIARRWPQAEALQACSKSNRVPIVERS